jgi:uroporphyrinogen decarboxylase
MKEIVTRIGAPASGPVRSSNPPKPAGSETGAPPVIVFSLGTHGNWPDLIGTRANVLGVDWQTDLALARKVIPEHIGMQGNLSPALIAEATPEMVAGETKKILETMRGRPGHIFNLGHGLTPGAKLENIQALVDTVRG